MMRVFSSILITFSLCACASQSPHTLTALSYSPQDLKVSSRGPASASDSHHPKGYISLAVPVAAFEKIRTDLETSQHVKLKSRGEAHITVVTPPEFKRLAKKVPAKDIYAIADQMNLQKSPYKLLCVGKGSAKEQTKEISTFYVVVESDSLFQVRKAIQKAYIAKGGLADDFNPDTFFPHVTVGFTERDLHLEDGVVKDASSCIYSLRSDG